MKKTTKTNLICFYIYFGPVIVLPLLLAAPYFGRGFEIVIESFGAVWLISIVYFMLVNALSKPIDDTYEEKEILSGKFYIFQEGAIISPDLMDSSQDVTVALRAGEYRVRMLTHKYNDGSLIERIWIELEGMPKSKKQDEKFVLAISGQLMIADHYKFRQRLKDKKLYQFIQTADDEDTSVGPFSILLPSYENEPMGVVFNTPYGSGEYRVEIYSDNEDNVALCCVLIEEDE